jgi:hypothetical protein
LEDLGRGRKKDAAPFGTASFSRSGGPVSLFFVFFHDFLAIVVAAFSAYVVRALQFVALRAFNQARSSQFPVGTAGIPTGFGHFSLRYCHIVTPPNLRLFL